MNNNFFCLMRYLRDNGVEAELLLLEGEDEHFLPNADSFDGSFDKHIKKLSWGLNNFESISNSTVISDLRGYDILIGCGPVPAFLDRAGLKLNIFIPYGSDFYDLPFRKIKIKTLKSFIKFLLLKKDQATKMARHQLSGISNSDYSIFEAANNEFTDILKRIKYKGRQYFFAAPILYYHQYEDTQIRKYASQFCHVNKILSIR